jgi:hypothetical protein
MPEEDSIAQPCQKASRTIPTFSSAHSAVDAIRDDLRRKVDAIWASEPSIPGVSLTAKQRHEMKKAEVRRVVEGESAARLKLVRPVVERSRADLLKRREKLTAKGSVALTGVAAERAMRIGDHFASLPPERRVLMALEAMNDPSTPENRELLAALAWSHPSMELVPADTRARIQGVLVASADPSEYASLTDVDTAISSTSESLDNLERWAASLPDEY